MVSAADNKGGRGKWFTKLGHKFKGKNNLSLHTVFHACILERFELG
jgi:hypothetical protein